MSVSILETCQIILKLKVMLTAIRVTPVKHSQQETHKYSLTFLECPDCQKVKRNMFKCGYLYVSVNKQFIPNERLVQEILKITLSSYLGF